MLPSLTRYYLLDVFTDRPFAGNPLAVFLDADGLEAERMQAIANELNLAETVFVGRARPALTFRCASLPPTGSCPLPGIPALARRTCWRPRDWWITPAANWCWTLPQGP